MTRLLTLALLFSAASAHAELHWIWTTKPAKDKEQASFRKTFTVPDGLKSAALEFTCDNGAKLLINGKPAGVNPDWQVPTKAEVAKFLKPGENQILVNAGNSGSAAGLIVKLTLKTAKGDTVVESDTSWEASQTGSDAWKPAISVGTYGSGPWGKALDGKAAKRGNPGVAIDAKDIVTLPGFSVEQLYVVPKEEQGSWVALTVDPKGRIIACDQYGGLYRVNVQGKAQVEKLPLQIAGAHGLLWAFDSLYFMKNEEAGDHGLYRITDSNGDGELDAIKLLRKINGGGEHGSHSLALSPDGNSIYFCNGNHTKLPDNMELSRAPQAWGEDHIVERMWDANGHARGTLAPGGYIGKTDPEGKQVELFCYGFRNQFDIAFNDLGDLFTYDSDMEWDIGSPWYCPTRVNHCISGADYGWRSGSGRWPNYYTDSLPTTVDIGPGSPTGVVAGTGAKFPAKYQRALFINDWTYGTMYAIHLTPDGASYKAEKEEFVSGKPLPLTDVVIHPDGAMYFAVGGRRTQSALYRLTYTGKESTAPAPARELTAEMKQRRELEKLHDHGTGPEAIDKAWPHLASKDRYLRWAARVAIERQPAVQWADRALAEKDTQASLEALIALCRLGDKALQPRVFEVLAKFDYAKLSEEQRLSLLRVYQLCVVRMGKPPAEVCAQVAARLDALFPTHRTFEDRELCGLLVTLDSPKVVAKTLALMATAKDDGEAIASESLLARNEGYAKAAAAMAESRPNKQQIALVFALRKAKAGWTPELRKQFFAWFPTTAPWKGGNSFKGFLNNARTEAVANFVPENERAELDALSTKIDAPAIANYVAPKGPGKAWTLDEVLALTETGLKGRNFEQGKTMFTSTMCLTCHRFNQDGGSIGPDISGAANRYTMRDFLENIIDPSKVISDQYGSLQIEKKDGSLIIGRAAGEENGSLLVMTNPMHPAQLTVVKPDEIKSKKDYPVSMMPPGLINTLNQDELLDLIAYVMSGGNAGDARFKK
jgi:putative heme-binding domain-containing protein